MSLHVWDLSTSDPQYVCGREPKQPAVHFTIQSRVPASMRRLERLAARHPVCRNCLRSLRSRSRSSGVGGEP